MSDVTVKQLANVLGLPLERLVEQLTEAGMKFSGPEQVVTSTEKIKLLGFLRRTHGKRETPVEESAGPSQITLRRTKVSELTVSSGLARGKTVAVEVRQKRTYVKRSVVQDDHKGPDAEREEAQRLLNESETRRAAEQAALVEADARRTREEEEKKREEERKRAELEATLRPAEPAKPEEEPKRRAEEKPRKDEKPARKDEKPARKVEPEREAPRRHKGVHGSHQMPSEVVVEEDPHLGRFARGELHLADPGAASRRAKRRPKPQRKPLETRPGSGPHGFSRPTERVVREIAIGESITVGELAQKLAVKAGDLIKSLMKLGLMATINQAIEHDTAVLVVEELGHTAVRAQDDDVESALLAQTGTVTDAGTQTLRPPVVTIMGHVDHGKTSLLDFIRRTKVAAGEAGGITQHIGAYHVQTEKGVISFLDTPGHAAFTAMRARGAKLTDIVVLVVAVDDGVMPQTVEAINHARAANVPLIVAVNKMDKPGADADNVKQGLVQHEVVPEEWGGDTIFVPVSARTGDGIDNLLDAILVQAEVMELKAVREGRATGVVVESSLDKGRGPVATVLVQTGTLRKGDFIVCGIQYGRVRAMFDESGAQIQEAGPSIPAVVLGLSGVPEAGDDLAVVADERLAKDVAQQREAKRRESRLFRHATKLEDIISQMGQQGGEQAVLNLVVKADVQGSAEALRDALTSISTEAVKVNVLTAAVGGITESDATLASASKAILVGFNVRADAGARKVITDQGVDLRYFSIIYDVIDQVKQVATGLLGTEIREEIIGTAQVRDVFRSSKFGAIAGCMVLEGAVKRNKPIRVLRDNVVIFQGELESLRRFKEAVEEVRAGMECGIGVKQYNDIKPGDQIECFERHEVARTL